MAAPGLKRRAFAGLLVALTVTVGGLAMPDVPAKAAAAPVSDVVETTTPALSSITPGRLDVFTRSQSGTLQYQYLPAGGSWTAVRDLGGSLASQPSVVSWAAGRFDVFARATDGTLAHRWFTLSGGWSGWENLGGSLRSAPSAVSWGQGQLHVFARASDDALWYRSYAGGTGWSGWLRVGGILSASPSAAAMQPGRLDVFVRATDGTLQHTWWAGAWSPFENLGGTLTSQPAAASTGVGRLDVAVRATDNSTRVKSFVRGSGWSAFLNRGGVFTSGPGATAPAGELVLAGRGTTGLIYTDRRSTAGTWSGRSILDIYLPVRRLGTWVDTLDYALDPVSSVARMKALGVRTLYLGTARYTSTSDFFDVTKAGQWLDQAHAQGIKVVGWYVPAYGDVARDVRRTSAIALFVSPGGQRFDAVGVDIERLRNPGEPASEGEVPLAVFNQRLVDHLAQVRAANAAVLVAIVPPPYATVSSPGVLHPRWEGFPWSSVGRYSDVVEPMAMWSNRANYTPDQVYSWTRDQITQASAWTNRPIAVEGGVGSAVTGINTPVTVDRMTRFVDALLDQHVLGGSHYDYASTTNDALWAPLQRLNGL